MTSLLDILKREEKLVNDFIACDCKIEYVRRSLNTIYGYNIDCDAYRRDVKRMSEKLDDLIAEQGKIVEELEIARSEISSYLIRLV